MANNLTPAAAPKKLERLLRRFSLAAFVVTRSAYPTEIDIRSLRMNIVSLETIGFTGSERLESMGHLIDTAIDLFANNWCMMLKHLHPSVQAARANPGDWVLKPQAAATQCDLKVIFQFSRHQ